MNRFTRSDLLFGLLALAAAFLITRMTTQPGYTDAYYYYNAGARLASGQGLTDAYLWTYLNAPDQLPDEAFRYWMPLPGLLVALGHGLLGPSYAAAQVPFVLAYAALAMVGYALGRQIGGTARHAWLAGLLTLFSGLYVRFWGTTSTFAPFGLSGALCLLLIGNGLSDQTRRVLWFGAGVAAGVAHLTRADGLLLIVVGLLALGLEGWRGRRDSGFTPPLFNGMLVTAGYLLVMLPWFLRNLALFGAILPTGGLQGLWLREYNDLFSYPPDASPVSFFADGLGLLAASRGEALLINAQRFVVEQGWIVMTPLMLAALWKRRRQPLMQAFWMYAVLLHLVMTFVFAYPGYRGGLFHSAAALMPWWAALGVVGLEDGIAWAAKRRRWNPRTAFSVFAPALVLLATVLSFGVVRPLSATTMPLVVDELTRLLPPDARVMANDPAALYYFSGLGGVVLPNETPDMIPQIAARYQVGYLLIQFSEQPDGQIVPEVPAPLVFDFDNPPAYLEPLPLTTENARLYAIRP